MKKSYNFASSLESHFHVNVMSNFWNREAGFYWSWLAIVVLSYSSAKNWQKQDLRRHFHQLTPLVAAFPLVLYCAVLLWCGRHFHNFQTWYFRTNHIVGSEHVDSGESVCVSKHQIFLMSWWGHWMFSSFEKFLSANGDLKSDIFAWMTVRSLHDESFPKIHLIFPGNSMLLFPFCYSEMRRKCFFFWSQSLVFPFYSRW